MAFYILTYLCTAVFILATGRLFYRQITLPLHVRWEIYPVQHETTARIAYGGSYMEKVNWWTSAYKTSPVNELKYMAPEILLLRGLWKGNRRLWFTSFPFHLGLYLMMATLLLLLLHAGFTLWEFSAFTGGGTAATLLSGCTVFAGWTGLTAGTIGGLGMLYKRITDRELRAYSTFVDYFNIIFILLFFLFALITCLPGDPFLDGAKAYVLGLLTGGASGHAYAPGQSIPGACTIVLASLLSAYIPLTHMSHMFMKYYLYHNIRWDDAPNCPGTLIESAVTRNLKFRPTWQARHIGADGQKTWRDIASSSPKELK